MKKIIILIIAFNSLGFTYNPKYESDEYFFSKDYDASSFEAYIEVMSEHFDIPVNLVKSVIHQESRFNHRATSEVDAKGLMQVMEATAQYMGKTEKESLYNPYTNIYYGTKYLNYLYEMYGNWVDVLGAYYAGPSRVNAMNSGELYGALRMEIKEYQFQVMVNRAIFTE